MRDSSNEMGTGPLPATRRGRRRMAAAALLGGSALLAAACSASGTNANRPPRSVAQLTITPTGDSTDANPSGGITVSAAKGTVENVTVGGDPVTGYFNAAHTVWHSDWALQPGHAYTVTATAADRKDRTVTKTSTFSTLRPRRTVQMQVWEGQGQTYGVGMPIMLTFSSPVTRRAAVERSLELWTSKPITGAWYWIDNENLVFRPRTYWPQHTRVRLLAHLDGLEVAPGAYGAGDVSESFRIGNSLIAVVSTTSHYAKIYYKDKLFGDWPVSTGSPGDDTANGTYLTIEKGNPVLMSGPGYTNFPVPYSVRFTWSGNYMHDAYWSVGEQGYTNVSHGCVNLSPYHAQIYYNLAVPGDPVTITNSPAAGITNDGWTEWFMTWKQLLKGSATRQAVVAGPLGSSFVNPATLGPVTASAPLHNSRPGNARAS